MPTLLNDYIIEGSTVRVDVSTKKFPNTETLIDIEDIDLINDGNGRWFAVTRDNINIYVQRRKKPKGSGVIWLHREIVKKYLTIKNMIDHKNVDSLNNKRENLRLCNHHQNRQNCKKHALAKSKYKGIYFHKPSKKWCARISLNGQRKQLGYFQNEMEAVLAYDKAAIENFGEFARLNFTVN